MAALAEAGLGVSVGEALVRASAVLAGAGCDTPRLDAALLLASALGVDRSRLVLDAGAPLGDDAAERFEALVTRRAAREPVAYILGQKEFRTITVAVDGRVLVPRPETELLVEVGISLPAGARVVDVGTGSGAVALALKAERPDLSLTGTDVSADALAVARSNGRALGLEVEFLQADLLEGVETAVDAVLANLPYVASGAELAPEITRYEPPGALFAGPDGLDAIRRLLGMGDRVPLMALEVGFDQARTVEDLMRGAGFPTIEALSDLAGHPRVVVGRA
jgi:release factor glutamine methyltransferase